MSATMPWSDAIRFSEVGRGPVRKSLEADEATRKAIARYLDLVSIESLSAEVSAKPWLDGAEITGRFKASITQTCSASGDPFPEAIDGEFLVRALPPGSINAPQEDLGEEIDLDPEADDPPDVLETDSIDLAGYVVEHLSLELDPFPRKPGAVFEPPVDEEPLSPFAALRALKKDDAPE